MNRVDALVELSAQISSENLSKTSFARARRALKVLGFNDTESRETLVHIGYYRPSGEPAKFLLETKGETR